MQGFSCLAEFAQGWLSWASFTHLPFTFWVGSLRKGRWGTGKLGWMVFQGGVTKVNRPVRPCLGWDFCYCWELGGFLGRARPCKDLSRQRRRERSGAGRLTNCLHKNNWCANLSEQCVLQSLCSRVLNNWLHNCKLQNLLVDKSRCTEASVILHFKQLAYCWISFIIILITCFDLAQTEILQKLLSVNLKESARHVWGKRLGCWIYGSVGLKK